ncbi:hypothetical protein [Filimonas effusa]|uniref:SWIM-type domain-containing protein n=1 Tax=Filimonas effusa TaxID=2508721 RepID=A0A4Q1D0I9_9BACT|nr:hypothetical protein [Filimonas effusa]RXK81266.1 hypothetical protein ESB13_20230 [Filimonas effusa]
MKIHKDDLRNTNDAYVIPLGRDGQLHPDSLKKHIDTYTLNFKQWHINVLAPLCTVGKRAEYYNTYGTLTYILGIEVSSNQLYVTCSCKRRVEKLCHHTYAALKSLLITGGTDYFLKLSKILQNTQCTTSNT